MKRFNFAVTAVLALCACPSGSVGESMQFNQITSSSKCPTGGVQIASGTDLDGDGALTGDEVVQRAEICNGVAGNSGTTGAMGAAGLPGRDGVDGWNGATGPAGKNAPVSVVSTTVLGLGDAKCPSGGVRLDFGFDEGTANGVLDPTEVRSTSYVCNGSPSRYVQPTEPPPGPGGSYTLSANGGDGIPVLIGASLHGGNGGTVSATMKNGTLGGNVKLFNSGSVDAGFEWPSVAFEPGPRPVRVAHDLQLKVFESEQAAMLSGQTVFVLRGSQKLISVVDGGVAEVSSLFVEPKVTLSVQSFLRVAGDVRNEGTIAAQDTTGLTISSHVFSTSRDSLVTTRVSFNNSGAPVDLSANRVVLEGTIDSRGTGSGSGGRVSVQGKHVVTGGSVLTSGGTATTGWGGSGGSVYVRANVFANRGSIAALGGNGLDGAGIGGQVYLEADGVSAQVLGSVTARGGTCSEPGCAGGAGGRVQVATFGAPVFVNAALDASGGNGGASGGPGGVVSVRSTYLSEGAPAGSVHVSGDCSSNGGTGRVGGEAGSITFELDPGLMPRGQEIELLGYANVLAAGGTGAAGGHGGGVALLTAPTRNGELVVGPTGAVINTAALRVAGGAGAGTAGWVTFGLSVLTPEIAPGEFIRNSGAIDARGGAGDQVSGSGGGVFFHTTGAISNHGVIELGAGASRVVGGNGGWVQMNTPSRIDNDGPIRANGAAGSQLGGRGGAIDFQGQHVTNSGEALCRGGASQLEGGAGGSITLFSRLDVDTTNTGTLDAAGGVGPLKGAAGSVLVR